MILGKLFDQIFKENIKIIVTSNTKISELYKDGLQRDQFIPFIKMMHGQSLEHELKISIATFYEALTIDLNYTNKYNSRYDGEQKFINPETLLPYKARDENISVGLSFMF